MSAFSSSVQYFRSPSVRSRIPAVVLAPLAYLAQGGQQSTNEQFGYLIDRLLMSARPRLVSCPRIGEIDRLDCSVVPRRGDA
jgi:hypothetical protein